MKTVGNRPVTQWRAMQALQSERMHQDVKHGTMTVNPHTVGEWLLIIEAELAEAKAALIKGGEGRNSVMQEIVQIGASALAAIEEHGL